MLRRPLIRCADCGYCGLRHKESGELHAVKDDHTAFRLEFLPCQDMRHPDFPAPDSEPYERAAFCYLNKKDLWKPEVGTFYGSAADHSLAFELHRCSAFTRRRVGDSPREHYEQADQKRQKVTLAVVAGVFTLIGIVLKTALDAVA